MINQSIIRASMLCALVVPSVSTAMERVNHKPTFSISEHPFDYYSPIVAGITVVGMQYLSDSPFLACGFNALGQTIKEHPLKATGVLASTVGSLWFLQKIRENHEKTTPLKREDLYRKTSYTMPLWISMGINAFLTNPLASSATTPLFIASALGVATTGLVANMIDGGKDHENVAYVTRIISATNNICRNVTKSVFKNEDPTNSIKTDINNLEKMIQELRANRIESWLPTEEMNLCESIINSKVISAQD